MGAYGRDTTYLVVHLDSIRSVKGCCLLCVQDGAKVMTVGLGACVFAIVGKAETEKALFGGGHWVGGRGTADGRGGVRGPKRCGDKVNNNTSGEQDIMVSQSTDGQRSTRRGRLIHVT